MTALKDTILSLADAYAMAFATQNATDWTPHQAALIAALDAADAEKASRISERDALLKHAVELKAENAKLREALGLAMTFMDYRHPVRPTLLAALDGI